MLFEYTDEETYHKIVELLINARHPFEIVSRLVTFKDGFTYFNKDVSKTVNTDKRRLADDDCGFVLALLEDNKDWKMQ